jgi:hypothetical protein
MSVVPRVMSQQIVHGRLVLVCGGNLVIRMNGGLHTVRIKTGYW